MIIASFRVPEAKMPTLAVAELLPDLIKDSWLQDVNHRHCHGSGCIQQAVVSRFGYGGGGKLGRMQQYFAGSNSYCRVYAGHYLTDIAHIGAAQARPMVEVVYTAPQRF